MLIGFVCGLICGFLCGVLRISHIIEDYYPEIKEDIISGRLARKVKGEDNE